MPFETPHLVALRSKHAHLDRTIRDQEHRPWPNHPEIHRMKLEKLRLKEEIDVILSRHRNTLQ